MAIYVSHVQSELFIAGMGTRQSESLNGSPDDSAHVPKTVRYTVSTKWIPDMHGFSEPRDGLPLCNCMPFMLFVDLPSATGFANGVRSATLS
ncbi:hypothetical protein F1880_000965 [Penicillium rolfsii]|nr:hypothetical protein F1880_000965 [Penicillium rolfsii]